MSYLIGYLAIGVVVCAVIVIAHHFANEQEPRKKIKSWIDSLKKPADCMLGFLESVVGPILATAFAIVAWPILIYWKLQERFFLRKAATSSEEKAFSVERSDLLGQVTIEEVERLEIVHDPLGAVPDLPFGHLNAAWRKFKDALLPGDEVWTFAADWTSEWGRREHRKGYVIVRAGEPGPFFCTAWRFADAA